jgi:TolB-like protein
MHRTLTLLLAMALPALAGAAPPTRIAVMDLQAIQGVAPGTAAILTNVAAGDLSRAGLDVVSRTDVANLLGFERQKELLGCSSDASCLAEIGGALGVDYLFTGQVGQIGSQFHLSIQIVDAKKARVAARTSRFSEGNEDALLRATREAIVTVLAAVVPAAAGAGRPPPASAAASGPRRSAWIAFGTAGALLAGGAASGLVAKSRYDAVADKRDQVGYADLWARKEPGIRSAALTADVLYAGGAVAAGMGAWLWFRAGAPVAIAPVLGTDSAGVAVAGRF